MELTVNGKKVTWGTQTGKTFQDLMQRIYREFVDKNNVIFKVAVNGEHISEEREKLLGTVPAEDISSIEVQTKHPLDLAHETMVTGLDYVGKLVEALRTSARSFRQKKPLEKVPEFQSCVDGLQWFFLMIDSLRGPLHLASDEMISAQKTIVDAESEAASALNELCDAREGQDLSGMADAIEYELIPNLETWRLWLLKKTDVPTALSS